MSELNYQSASDRRYERGPLLRKLFGPSQAEVWSNFAEATGHRYEHGTWGRGSKVVAEVGEWTVTLDTYVVSTGKSTITYTRLRAPFVNPERFRFVVYRASVFTSIGKRLGMQDVTTGNDAFDDAFVVKSNDEAKVRWLLADERLRRMIAEHPRVRFEVAADRGWFKKRFPEGVDQLQFLEIGIIKDTERLQKLFELFGHTLHRLCHLGSAYENDPKLKPRLIRPPGESKTGAP